MAEAICVLRRDQATAAPDRGKRTSNLYRSRSLNRTRKKKALASVLKRQRMRLLVPPPGEGPRSREVAMKITDAFDRIVSTILDGATLLGAIVATVLLAKAAYAPAVQAGPTAAFALCFVVIPYCLSAVLHRSIQRDRWRGR